MELDKEGVIGDILGLKQLAFLRVDKHLHFDLIVLKFQCQIVVVFAILHYLDLIGRDVELAESILERQYSICLSGESFFILLQIMHHFFYLHHSSYFTIKLGLIFKNHGSHNVNPCCSCRLFLNIEVGYFQDD